MFTDEGTEVNLNDEAEPSLGGFENAMRHRASENALIFRGAQSMSWDFVSIISQANMPRLAFNSERVPKGFSDESAHSLRRAMAAESNRADVSTQTYVESRVIRPYWAFAAFGAACASLGLLLGLVLGGSVSVIPALFLLTFGLGLGGSSLGMLMSAQETVRWRT